VPDDTKLRLGGIGAGHLKAFVERIERLEEEIKSLNADKAEIYSEAKGTGYDLPALKIVIRRRRMDSSALESQDDRVDLYERALAGDVDVSGPAPQHEEARAAGREDGLAGTRQSEQRWPNGTYGCADYALGWVEGERQRRAEAEQAGRSDGLNDCRDNASRWPAGDPGHDDYRRGWDDGHTQRVDRDEADRMPPAASRARARARADA
jgi:uncharacterized protein (UPF0335 family)